MRTYDALNRVTNYTDVNGRIIRYDYDAVGNLARLIIPITRQLPTNMTQTTTSSRSPIGQTV